jgi:hypothetical protein
VHRLSNYSYNRHNRYVHSGLKGSSGSGNRKTTVMTGRPFETGKYPQLILTGILCQPICMVPTTQIATHYAETSCVMFRRLHEKRIKQFPSAATRVPDQFRKWCPPEIMRSIETHWGPTTRQRTTKPGPKSDCRKKSEARKIKRSAISFQQDVTSAAGPPEISHSSFIRHSCFVIRNSIPPVPRPNARRFCDLPESRVP